MHAFTESSGTQYTLLSKWELYHFTLRLFAATRAPPTLAPEAHAHPFTPKRSNRERYFEPSMRPK